MELKRLKAYCITIRVSIGVNIVADLVGVELKTLKANCLTIRAGLCARADVRIVTDLVGMELKKLKAVGM